MFVVIVFIHGLLVTIITKWLNGGNLISQLCYEIMTKFTNLKTSRIENTTLKLIRFQVVYFILFYYRRISNSSTIMLMIETAPNRFQLFGLFFVIIGVEHANILIVFLIFDFCYSRFNWPFFHSFTQYL